MRNYLRISALIFCATVTAIVVSCLGLILIGKGDLKPPSWIWYVFYAVIANLIVAGALNKVKIR